jgi:hypothetical protein
MAGPERQSSVRFLVIGTLAFIVMALVAMRFWQEPSEQQATQAKRVDLVEQMQRHLASAAEAEKRAVLAITDEDSQSYADEARKASAEVARERDELEALLQRPGSPKGAPALLAEFSFAFADYQRVDDEVLRLAVKNTNLKAASLAYGPAAGAMKEVDRSLSHIVTESAASNAAQARKAMLLASQALAAALRIEVLLPPHIAEQSDRRMDEMEAAMNGEDQVVHKDLAALAALLPRSADVQTAKAAYDRFGQTRKQILALSRENTNVRSLSLSLNEKRKATMRCEEILTSLEKAMRVGAASRPAAKPR